MSTGRQQNARRLSSILTRTSGVHVECRYDRTGRRYAIHWTGGPTAIEMHGLAAKNATQVPLLDINGLVWLRTEPRADPRGRYDYET
jgi:hypothetical protein